LNRFENKIKITVLQMILNQNHVENDDFLNQTSKSHRASEIVTKYVPCLLVVIGIVIRTDLF